MSNLTNNTTELQAIIDILVDKINGIQLPALTNEGTAADLLEGKEFIDSFGNKIVGTLSLDAEMAAQAELIESIKSGLEGKAGGSGGDTLSAFIGSFENGTTSVTLPEGLQVLRNHAFYGDKTITEIILPNSLVEIGPYAFMNCSQLDKMTIPDNVAEIGMQCFATCTGLTEVKMSKNLTQIGSLCFTKCSCLLYDFSECTQVPTLGSNAFNNIKDNAVIKVPSALYNEWIAATNWSAYADYIVAV